MHTAEVIAVVSSSIPAGRSLLLVCVYGGSTTKCFTDGGALAFRGISISRFPPWVRRVVWRPLGAQSACFIFPNLVFLQKSARFMDIASFMALVRFHKMLVFLYSHIFENS